VTPVRDVTDLKHFWVVLLYTKNRELYRIVRPCNYRGQQQLPDPAVANLLCVVAVYV